jgi:sulfonate transport system permease protein
MKNMLITRKTKSRLSSFIFPIVLLLLWQFISSAGYASSAVVPSPKKVLNTFQILFTQQTFFLNITASLERVMIGFLIGSLTGFLFGLLMGLSRTAEIIFAPSFHTVRQVPMIGWIPLIVMWFGMTELPRILIISIAAFYPITLNTFAGVRSVPREYLELASVYGYKRFKLIRRIILPAALPSIITGLTLSLGMSWAILMAAEIFIQTEFGIGTQIQMGRQRFNMPLVVTGILTVGLLGFVMTMMIEKLARIVDRGRAIGNEN